MNIIAIDFGTKNIGLAWADTAMGVVLPYGIIKKEELSNFIKKEKIDKIIIGFPIGLDGKENTNSDRVKKFAQELESQISVPIEFFDERFSSVSADRMGDGVSRDEKSAMIILEHYLEAQKQK